MSETSSNEKETERIEAFSDGVFAIALTLLAIDLKAPVLDAIDSRNLAHALAERWTEYFAFINSFAAILLMWTSHHQIFKMIRRSDARFILVNGLLLFFIAAFPFPTSVLAKYVATDAGTTAAAFYAGYCVFVDAAFVLLWAVASKSRDNLADGVTDEQIRRVRRDLFIPLPIYLTAMLLAFVNPWITVAITAALWIYWAAALEKRRIKTNDSIENT